MTVAILSARALGDGLLGMVLAHNLQRAGRPAVVLHTALTELGAWFPWATLEAHPGEELATRLQACDALFVSDPSLVADGPKLPEPTVRFGKDQWLRDEPYLHSLRAACVGPFQLDTWSDAPGLIAPSDLPPAVPRRIALHPTSANASKNWPVSRWLHLAQALARAGWLPQVLLAAAEVDAWSAEAGDAIPVAVPGTLDAVARWLHGCDACIATDSGIAHLASALGLPTLSIFRKASAARFWAPAWGRVATVTAPWRLPGGGGHRLWGSLLSPARVQRAFERLVDGHG